MKKLVAAVVMAAGLMMTVGCAKTATAPATPPPPLIPGALNAFDQNSFRTLATIRAFADKANSNTAVLTASQRVILNQLILDINAADVIYSAYHIGTATQAAVEAALAKVQRDQTQYIATPTGAN